MQTNKNNSVFEFLKPILPLLISGMLLTLAACSESESTSPEKPAPDQAQPESGPIVDVSEHIQFILTNRDRKSNIATLQLKNISNIPILAPLSLIIQHPNKSKVQILNADGETQKGDQYFNIELKDNQLAAGAVTDYIVIKLAHAEKTDTVKNLGSTFSYRAHGVLPATPLEPRSYPYALPAQSGKIAVTFKVHVIAHGRAKPEKVLLKQKGIRNLPTQFYNCGLKEDCESFADIRNSGEDKYILNDKGEKGDRTAGDNIYAATIDIDTNRYNTGDCLLFEASLVSTKAKINVKSSVYSLCLTSFPTKLADSDTHRENIVSPALGVQAVANELLVRFRKSATEALIKSTVDGVNAQVVGSILPRRLYQIRFASGLSPGELIEIAGTLNAQSQVESAYLNLVGSFTSVPNDVEFSNQHGLQWINAHTAWDLDATGNGITVTILDSGISAHADIMAPIGSCASDSVNHGTAVAGVVGATTDNSIGIAGTARASTLECFVVSSDAVITLAEMVAGFQTVSSSGTGAVVNASFNIVSAPPPIDLASADQWDLCSAINDVVLNGATPVAVVVAAAGNDGSNSNHYPARCNDTSHASHGGLTRKDLFIPVLNSVTCNTGCTPDTRYTAAGASNYGPWVDVAAPGTNIRTTNNAGGYTDFTGTSFAAPMVSAAVAQLLSCGVALDQIQPTLTASAPVNVAYPGGSAPRIDVLAAITAANSTPAAIMISASSINENINTTGGTSIGTLTTSDTDTCDQFSYNIQGGSDAAVFSIGGAGINELILSDGILNFESKPSYNVTVRVTDSGSNTFDQPFVITVNNLNETPVIGNQSFSIAENSANATVVGTVVATDPDAGTTLNYSITGGTGMGVFSINSSSGQVAVANSAALNFETTSSFTLNVQVSDGVLNASAVITINLTNVNEAPDINSQTFIIDENLPNGSPVGTVTVTDPDAGDTHTFSITSGNTGNAFAINNSGNITVVTTSAVDFEITPVFSLVVEVADAGLLTDIAIITVNLNDLPDSGPIPNPILAWVAPVPFENYIDAFGNPYTRYRMEVTNRAAYPSDMFAAAPSLPPCGLNANSSRTWVHIYNAADDSYIYGFCALGNPNNLGLIWFARPQSMPAPPPASIYIKLIDRQTMIEYTSNTITLP